MLSAVLAALMIASAPQQTPAPPPTTILPSVPVTGEPVQTAEADTRRVCRYETVTGSNRRTRVCRDVPRQGVQSQEAREFMRDNQRVRMPDT